MIATVEVDTVLRIHNYLTERFAGSSDPIFPPGLRDRGLLESAVYRQHINLGGELKYPTVPGSAATLMYGLCNNHPFHNGNKRTALLAGLLHLDLNEYVLDGATNDQVVLMMTNLAAHTLVPEHRRRLVKVDGDAEVTELAHWLRLRCREVQLGERNIDYGRLYHILGRYGFKMGKKNKNKVEVLRKNFLGLWTCVLKIPCPGDSYTMSTAQLKFIRSELRLTSEHGVDSHSFYGEQNLIDHHIREYQTVLRRLARL